MSQRIRAHLRTNVVGYVAIFLFAIGGTAYATHPGGVNTISSGDIINNEIRSEDIRSGAVQNSDTAPDSVTSGKIKNQEVRSGDVANDSSAFALTGVDIADTDSLGSPEIGGLGGGDVTDGSITDADTSGLVPYGDVLWAVVNSDGSLSRASNGTTTSALEAAGSGDYEVDFGNGGLDPCASIAQISFSGFGVAPGPGEAASAQGELVSETIDVRTYDSAGTSADRGFTVHVLCPEGSGGAAFAKSADRGRR
jgi:hypothetical protein